MSAVNRNQPQYDGNSAISFITDSVDAALRYLRNIRRKPISLQIAIGTTSGCVTGYIFSRTSKLAAIIAGCSIIILQFFNYRGYFKFNRTQIQRDFGEFKDALRNEFGLEKPLVPSARKVDDFLTKNGYLFAGFIAGSLIGYGLS